MADKLEWERLQQLPDDAVYTARLDPNDYPFGADVHTGTLLLDFQKQSGEWKPIFVYTDSPLLRRVRMKGGGRLKPGLGMFTASKQRFDVNHPTTIARYSGKDLGSAPTTQEAYAELVQKQKEAGFKADR